ncbi:dihydrolipoyllysine-residue acetyltransferase [Psychrobium sp. 1_MG-2023]|uniref:dihydrolipoyllysine-residue acetyltransferase n=1 Tax=Psychrobium sp. 1_MG-2023 TaxID=3062624 RepID=UPI000C34C2A4|nr:dihydrolipoyllysine-residue acetyltransferase [Psychrobium sp. 1_MG-2023]MDP2560620.1 dihydrolipoyllysine-residue acetyltransferase [Psychrobium sp. 1_MG-2023]PKF57605.1 dihydrolipoamide acetyltransferase [Alteromonadales bacterium alter-6D02]
MAQDFLLPDIGEGIVECELVEWLVAEGDTVAEDQPVADVMTDKALVQIPSMHNGKITQLYHQKGDIAKVHSPLYAIEPEGEVIQAPAEVLDVASDESRVQQSSSSTSTEIKQFILPDIGEGIVECEVVEWLVNVGDSIEEDQPVADVMTDKALVQIPAVESGVVTELFCDKGAIIKVHTPLFSYQVAGAASSATEHNVPADEPIVSVESQASQQDVTKNNNKAIASPAVRRVARELNVDLTKVAGSGKNGRVYKEDVLAYNNPSVSAAKVEVTTAVPATVDVSMSAEPVDGVRIEPLKGIKAAMAKQMVESVSTIPHFTYSEEIDMTDLIALRLSLKEQYAKQDIKLTLMPFFIKAMSLALKEFPILNSQLNAAADEIHYFQQHNIGMAVDSKIGLLVPNIKGVQNQSIIEVANEVTRLTESARAGRLNQQDLSGGTITISNIGVLGGTTATPIINKPEVAIVALGKVQKLPRFNEQGEVEARQIMTVSWSGDHRVIDGGTIARFCNLWKSYLEKPNTMLMAMS